MTASLHKLTAGSGYDYLTRQVAVQDVTEKGHASLASYYSEKGEVPGVWRGSGVAGLGDLAVGDVVTAEQMQALFGAGFHPNSKARLAALPMDASKAMIQEAARLGRPFRVFQAATEFRSEVEERTARWRSQQGLAATATVPVGVRAEIVNAVAGERFAVRMGRAPSGSELAGEVARLSRNPTTACAGYDVTFTPVKSVSALWAVAPQSIAATIERAHNAAVEDALRYLEREALFSRAGTDGVRQVDVRGLVAAAFTHRDSRAGDPNLHTHVAIANKVQAVGDGQWRSIDGRLIYKAMVSVSETYNTQLEAHLRESLGVEFVERASETRDRRPVREIAGVPAELVELWSSRRAVIELRQSELAVAFQEQHGRPPTPAEAIRLHQQATLETREAKHEPRSLEEQRAVWRSQAVGLLGAKGIEQMVAATVRRGGPSQVASLKVDLERIAAEVVDRVARSRASWQVWHLRAEASRRAREVTTTAQGAEAITQRLTDLAVSLSLPLGAGEDGIEEPVELRRVDGSSMYSVAGSRLFTSQSVVEAEQRVLVASGRVDGRRVGDAVVELGLLESVANGVTLNDGQAQLVRSMATSGARVQLALAAAGTGKTTAMRVLRRVWEESGGTVLGLAPSAVAATTLAEAVGDATTVAKLLWDLRHGSRAAVDAMVGESTLIVVDEAGMTDTLALAELVDYALARGASVRLVGDDQQLAAIGAGGVLRDLERTRGAARLEEVVRFVDDGEKAASLALREGDPAALGWYLDHGRVHAGSAESVLVGALQAWVEDTQRGLDSVMLGGTRELVAELNRRAQSERLHGQGPGLVAALSDGNAAGVGDVVLTRRNDRRLRLSATDWVKNGDRWIVEHVDVDGGLRVRHRDSGLQGTLPGEYVAAHVELGYATTVHSAQGATVDSTHTILTGAESRQQLYVATSRGRQENHLWVCVVGEGDEHTAFQPATLRPPTAVEVVESVLARDASARSVSTELEEVASPGALLAPAVQRFHDAVVVGLEVQRQEELVELESVADEVVVGLTDSEAWTTLRRRLLLAAGERSLVAVLQEAAVGHAWAEVDDPAALLASLLPEPTGGPLPWLPAVPESLAADPRWGPYLAARAERVVELAASLRSEVAQAPRPSWAPVKEHLSPSLLSQVAVWRAARAVEPTDQRPTGERVPGGAASRYQDELDRRLLGTTPSLGVAQLRKLGQGLGEDPATAALARELARLEDQGRPVGEWVATALGEGPLPAERPAAALLWRIRQVERAQPAPEDADLRWQEWAESLDPALVQSPQWPSVRGLLANLDDAVDLAELQRQLRGKGPREIRSALLRLRALTQPAQELPRRTSPRPIARDRGSLAPRR